MKFNSTQYLGFDDRWFLIFGILLVSLLTTMSSFGIDAMMEYFWELWPIGLLFTTAYWLGYRFFIFHYHTKFPDLRFTYHQLIYLLIGIVTIFGLIKIVVGFPVNMLYEFPEGILNEDVIAENIPTVLLIIMILAIYEAAYYLNKLRNAEMENAKLLQISTEHQLNTLINQVNPHFLFNSLNTLATMIPSHPSEAITFVEMLSKTYRKVLEFRSEKLITIERELEAFESYVFLLKTRFQGKIHIFNHIDKENYQDFILPLSLQMLVENAVKHNIVSNLRPLKIYLESKGSFIVVRNNLQLKNQDYASTKVGLANIKERVRLIAGEDIIIEQNNQEFIVKIPIIKQLKP